MNESVSSSKGTVKWEELQKSGNICDKYIRCLSKILKDDQNINDKEKQWRFCSSFWRYRDSKLHKQTMSFIFIQNKTEKHSKYH